MRRKFFPPRLRICMNIFELHAPEIGNSGAVFSWTVSSNDLYLRNSFRINIPDADKLPVRFWLLLAMICLHTHWILLRPLTVKLPHQLLPGEKDIWLRLLQIGFQTLEGHRQNPDTDLAIDLQEGDRILPPARALSPSARCATSFSGGRDSLVQTGLLLEFSERPLLVATTSPMPPLSDHSNERRRHVFDHMKSRSDLEFVEVTSDFRSSWNNSFAAMRGYPVSVNAMTDTLLYTSAAIAASRLRNINSVYLAAESEVSDNARRDGRIVLFHHFMYSIPIQHGISLLLKPWGMQYGSLTCPLRGPHIQTLLRRRYPELANWQYSCWKVSDKEAACSCCDKCLLMGLGIIIEGGKPEDIGIELVKMMHFAESFKPIYRDSSQIGPLARDRVTFEHQMNIIRYMQRVGVTKILKVKPGLFASPGGIKGLMAYASAHRRAMRMETGKQAGWRPEYGDFIPGAIKNRVLRLYSESLSPADGATYAEDLSGNRFLVEYLNQSGIHSENT